VTVLNEMATLWKISVNEKNGFNQSNRGLHGMKQRDVCTIFRFFQKI